MSDFHSPAYYIAGRSVLAFKSGEVSDLTVEDPDAVLADVSKDIERAFSEFPTAETSQQQRDACMAVLVVAMSQRQGAALSAEWNRLTTPLFQFLAAAHRVNRESRQFIIDEWALIKRLGSTLASEKKLSASQVQWSLDSEPQGRVA